MKIEHSPKTVELADGTKLHFWKGGVALVWPSKFFQTPLNVFGAVVIGRYTPLTKNVLQLKYGGFRP